jgi:hypothetical protein
MRTDDRGEAVDFSTALSNCSSNPHPQKMPSWLDGILLILSGVWVLESALFFLSYRAFGRS